MYGSKSSSVGQPVVTSQPGQASSTQYHPLHSPGSTFAQPPGSYVTPAAQSHHVDESSQQAQLDRNYTVRPPIGRWRDSICDCTNNLFPSCYCVCCCYYGMWLVAQSKSPLYWLFASLLQWSSFLTFHISSRMHKQWHKRPDWLGSPRSSERLRCFGCWVSSWRWPRALVCSFCSSRCCSRLCQHSYFVCTSYERRISPSALPSASSAADLCAGTAQWLKVSRSSCSMRS